MIFAFKSRIFALKSQNTQKFKDFAAKCQTRDMLHRKALTNASFSLIFITHREKSQKDFHRAFAPYSRDWNRQFQTQRIGTQTLTSPSGRGSLSSVCAYRFCRTSVCKQTNNGTHAFFAFKGVPQSSKNHGDGSWENGATLPRNGESMKKIVSLIGLMALLVTGCATSKYNLKENWIDDNDLQYALQHPNLNEWFPVMGNPVVTEYSGDTIYFVYNYHPALFATVKNGVEYKPNNNDRINGVWGERNEFLAMLIKDNKLIGIERMEKYSKVQDNRTAESKSTNWLVVALLGVAGTIAAIALFK